MSVLTQTTVTEWVGGEPYEYAPLGDFVVVAPGVCGGEPTFKHTRIGVRHALDLMQAGRTLEEVTQAYCLPTGAVREALDLAVQALLRQAS